MFQVKYQLVVQLILLLLLLKSWQCLRLESTSPQLDKSGWRTIESKDTVGELVEPAEAPVLPKKRIRNKNLVEWDDDDLNELNRIHEDESVSSPQESLTQIDTINATSTLAPGVRSNQSRRSNRKIGRNKFSRLVYHGQVKDNVTLRMYDGLKLHVNIYKPLTIRRRSSETSSAERFDFFSPPSIVKAQGLPKTVKTKRVELEEIKKASLRLEDEVAEKKRVPIVEQSSSSEWKPIVSGFRSRRSDGKKAVELSNKSEAKQESIRQTKIAPDVTTTDEFQWKPIKARRSKQEALKTEKEYVANSSGSDNVVYGEKAMEGSKVSSSLEEPFDDDGIIVARKGSIVNESPKRRRESKASLGDTGSDSRWTPVEMTTTESPVTTTVAPPSTNSSNLESAQKSASDLNYIYSSQPNSQSQSDFRQASNNYYSNYLTQSQPATDQPINPPSNPGIIDTTSGQVPEMVPDRVDPAQAVDNFFSLPQNTASFQPAQPPPSRYDSGNSYYSNSYGNSYRPQPNPPQQVRQSPAPTASPQREIVRQEHHYHYYNQQQPQQQQPQQDRSLQQPVQTQPQPQSIIRELQPIMISQPIIQQQSTTSTTPAPQIIREIIREVPAPAPQIPVQIPRIIMPPSVPINIPPPNRELDPPMAFSYGQPSIAPAAQRIIRQISGSLPNVAMRAIQPTVRLSIPSIQLPVRLGQTNQAPVTRQTGSFVIPPMPKQTTTYMTETQAVPTHTTIMHTTQFTPATRTTVYTTDHAPQTMSASTGYRKK